MIDLNVNSFCGKFNVFHSSWANMYTLLALIFEIRRFDRWEHLVQTIVIHWRTTGASIPIDRHGKAKGLFVAYKYDDVTTWKCFPHYRKTSSISRTKSQNLNVSNLVVQLALLNQLKPGIKSRMKMQLGQRRQAMLQLHLSCRQFHCLPRCDLYSPWEGNHRSSVDSPHKGNAIRSFDVSLDKRKKQWSCQWFKTVPCSCDITLNHQDRLLCSLCYRIENIIGITLVSGHLNGYWTTG